MPFDAVGVVLSGVSVAAPHEQQEQQRYAKAAGEMHVRQ
jgi:hypothetical protein